VADGLAIRPLAEADYAAWRPLWDGYNAFYGREGETALPEEITAATWARIFDPAEPVHAFVAERDRAIVGIVHYLFHRSTTLMGPICYLQDLFTAAEARGGGVGRALIEAAYAAAKTAGSSRVYWQTHETNAVAMRLYDQVATKSGFLVYRKEL
jgi:GNAT superfamily N-acetyltransferase